jgi:hypothetical protein
LLLLRLCLRLLLWCLLLLHVRYHLHASSRRGDVVRCRSHAGPLYRTTWQDAHARLQTSKQLRLHEGLSKSARSRDESKTSSPQAS